MAVATGAAIGLGAIAAGGALANWLGNKEQANAAEDAAQLNAQMFEENKLGANQAAGYGLTEQQNAYGNTLDNLTQGYQGAVDYASQGYGQQRADILGGGNNAAGAIAQGQGGALDALYGGAGQGIGYVNSGLESGVGAIGGRTDRSGQMLDQQGGLYGNYQADPGYEFRRKAGEDSIRRQQAAQGGRFGGAAMQALVDYNQNSASQEFGNYVNRANSEFGAANAADSQSLSAASATAGLYGNASSQAANMAYGSGQGAANIQGQGASQLASIYSNTGSQLGGQSAAAGAALSGLTQDYSGSLANAGQQYADKASALYMHPSDLAFGQSGAMAANNASQVPYAGGGTAAIANAANNAAGLGMTLWGAGAFGGGGGGGAGGAAGSGAGVSNAYGSNLGNFQLAQPSILTQAG